MRKNFAKTVAVSVLVLAFAPATQAFAWCGGYCGGYSGYGCYGGGYPSAARSQSYVPQQTVQQTDENNFDPTVFDIQMVLFEQGYYEGDLDGVYGSVTEAALIQFQEDNGIEQTEDADVAVLKADSTTLEALGLL